MTKGEKKIFNILKQQKISFQQEYSFKELKGAKELLRFDFAFLYKGKLFLCEYDGRQHFEYVKYFHKTPIGFRRQKEYDIRKNKFCLKNKIPLIRVPYWELENLSFQTLLNNESFRVHDPNHNINLMKDRGVK